MTSMSLLLSPEMHLKMPSRLIAIQKISISAEAKLKLRVSEKPSSVELSGVSVGIIDSSELMIGTCVPKYAETTISLIVAPITST